jgi:hypothetical protein
MEVRDDAWLHAPTLWMIEARAERDRSSLEQAFVRMESERSRILDRQRDDAYRYALEPSIWLVSDALEDFPYCTVDTERMLSGRFGCTWAEFKQRMREHLGFAEPVRSILDTGANRSAKSWRAVKRAIMTAAKSKAEMVVMMVHETQERSKNDQQALVWNLLPAEWRIQQKTVTTWIHYNTQNGFSNDKITLPNLVQMRFHFYTQDVKKTLEGTKPIRANLDESFTIEWLEAMERRCAQFNGVVHATFTPVYGWTDGIAGFIDGMTPVKTMPAFLLPRDGGEALPWLAMGISEAEWRELAQAEQEKRPATAPQSRPQDCLAWLEGKTGLPESPRDRVFDVVPRVAKCAHPGRAVVYYQPCDNPYSKPRNLLTRLLQHGSDAGRDQIRKAVYSIVSKKWQSQFPKFDAARHTCPRSAIPLQGANYMFMDPAGARNDFLLWGRVHQRKVWIYREWPGNYHIPGVGMPEEWTVPSSRTPERGNDGERGEAQRSWGFSQLRMKFEMARLERWAMYREWAAQNGGIDEVAPLEEIRGWEPRNDDGEQIRMRYIDSRPATAERKESDRVTTLYTDLLDLGLDFELAPGADVMDGVKKINSALEADTLVICDECVNTIYAMRNWTNADGQKGACKEPIDLLRWLFDKGLALEDDDDGRAAEPEAESAVAGGWTTRGRREDGRTEYCRRNTEDGGGAVFVGR